MIVELDPGMFFPQRLIDGTLLAPIWRACRRGTFATCFVVGLVATGETPEEQLRELIAGARDLPQESESVATWAGRVDSQLEQHSLRSVVRAIRALALLHAGDEATARTILEALAADSRDDAGNHSARVLLSLIDLEGIVEELKMYYGRHLRYPASLDELRREFPERTLPPRDRWGDRWQYRLTAPRFFQVGEAQTYELASPNIRGLADLSAALAKPYAEDLRGVVVSRVIQAPGEGGAIVAFMDENNGRSFTLSEGAWDGSRWFLAWIGNSLFISDGFHFFTVPAPRAD